VTQTHQFKSHIPRTLRLSSEVISADARCLSWHKLRQSLTESHIFLIHWFFTEKTLLVN